MASNPFPRPRKSKFLFRAAFPATGAFVAGVFVLGVLATNPDITEAGTSRRPSTVAPARVAQSMNPFEAAYQHVAQTADYWIRVPEACVSGAAVNEFQKTQCQDFWNRQYVGSALAAIPFVLVVAFLSLLMEQYKGFFRRSRRTIESGRALLAGTVTQPAEAKNDFFGWLFCLKAVSVQLPNRAQTRVYIPLSAIMPLPGQTMAIFDGGEMWGKRRHVAILYAPHVGVVRGS